VDHRIRGPIALIDSLDLKDDLLANNYDPYLLWCGKCVTDELIEHIQAADFKPQEVSDTQKDSCPNCNSINEIDDIFCSQCGEKV
jgi:ribosomal protein S27AE